MRWSLLLLSSLVLFEAGSAGAADDTPRFHTVYSGQRLGSIAKRYGVSVDALCHANDIDRGERIKPGQKLVVPARSDKDGSRARAYAPKRADAGAKRSAERDGPSRPTGAKSADSAGPVTHTVHSGQRLESIAKRYGVSIEALCSANGIRRKDTLKPGQLLTIPKPDEIGSRTESADADKVRVYGPPKRKGYVELMTYNARWRGQVTDKKGRVRPEAAQSVSTLLGATGGRPRIDTRLIKLLSQISDKFGGRPIRIVSGYRTTSYFEDSRHKVSRAVDFSIPGVPNGVLRDYLRTLRDVGVGYYPNSSFVHLDVRVGAAYWVDYARPGEAPRDRQHAEDVGDKDLDRELNELLKKTAAGVTSAPAPMPEADLTSKEDAGTQTAPAQTP
jgi:LysM repeat protein